MTEIEVPEIEVLMEEYATQNDIVREAKKIKDNIKAKVQTILALKEVEVWDAPTLRLTHKEQKRKTLDKVKLQEFLETKDTNISAFETESISRTLRIVRKEENKDE